MRSGRTIKLALLVAAAITQTACSQTSHRNAADRQQAAKAQTPAASTSAPSSEVTGSITQAAPVTDIEGAVRRVVSWHPSIQEAAGRIRQQNELIADARSGYRPSVGGGLDLAAQKGNQGDWAPRFNATASQMIYDFGKVSGRVEAESAITDVRRAEFLATVDDLIRETVLASVEVMRNTRLSAVARDQVRDVSSIAELVNARTDRGASTRSDKLQAQARIQAAQSTSLEINAEKQRWQGALNSLLGQMNSAPLRQSFPSTLDKACAGPEPVWETVPTVIAAKSRKREADARVKLARADMLPTIALEGTTRMKTWGSGDSDYMIGVTIKGDLYNGGSFRARQNAARYGAQASEAAIAVGRYDAQRSWIQSASQVSSLSTLLRSLGSRQTMMRETRDLYQKQFIDLGTRTLLDVLNADQELHAARFDEINTRFDLYKLSVECAYAAGRLRDAFGLSSQSPSYPQTTSASSSPAPSPPPASPRSPRPSRAPSPSPEQISVDAQKMQLRAPRT